LTNGVSTRGTVIVHVEGRTELLQLQETTFGQQKSWFLTILEQYVDFRNFRDFVKAPVLREP
jgi:hypothetical protein